MNKDYVTKDKLYLLNKLVKEVRKLVKNADHRRKLKHWDELLNKLINSDGDSLIDYLRIIKQDRKNTYVDELLDQLAKGRR